MKNQNAANIPALLSSPKGINAFQTRLCGWYDRHHRKLPWRETSDPYKIWVSEVMLQQTQVATTIPYYFRFIDRFPKIEDLAKADLEIILKMWEGLGYYARARNLHKAAKLVTKNFNSIVPDTFDRFKSLPGVGDYIAAAVLSIAFDQPYAVVDGNVKRVLARLCCLEFPVNGPSSHKQFKSDADRLLDKSRPGIFNQAMMELGALVCTPKTPQCDACPVLESCEAHLRQKIDLFPKRLKSKKIPTHKIAVGIVGHNGRILITRRKLDGLLGGLWEFPGGKIKKGETPQAACVREIKEETNLDIEVVSFLTSIRHAYTHFKIEMDVFFCCKTNGRVKLKGPIRHKWITPAQINQFAFPGANKKFIPLIDAELLKSL